MSGHKMHGPKGVGALYVHPGSRLQPLFFGGGQERGLRPGTPDTAAIAGFGVAAELARLEGSAQSEVVTRLRERLLVRLRRQVPDLRLNGHPSERLPSNLSLTVPNVEARVLQELLAHRLVFNHGTKSPTLG